jgi:hypothetical protein
MLAHGFRGMLSGFGSIVAPTVTAATITATTGFEGDMGSPGWLGPIITDATGSLVLTSGRAYAQYLGEVPKALTSILATYYLHGVSAVAGGGGASVNWAEVAIATGTLGEMEASTSLTVLAYTSINGNVTAAGTQWYGTSITATVPARTGLWLVFASAYETTQVSVRIPTNFLNARGYARTANAFQPSAQIGTPTAFAATVATGTAVPIMGAQFS